VKIGLVAGEASGDLLGAGLIRELRRRVPGAVFEGVAGPQMRAEGCIAWAEAESLAVFGLVEPLRHVPRLLKLRRSLVKRWRADPPDAFVGIDAPDFNFGLERALRRAGIRTAHYVSPTVWAWRPGRIRTVAASADLVLCLFPFEEALYDKRGVDAVFVGNPRADAIDPHPDVEAARRRLGITGTEVVAMLPGSRTSEVARLGPVFAAAARRMIDAGRATQFVTPAASRALREAIEAQLATADVADRFTVVDGNSIDAMSAADVVLLASGTAALESALLSRPTVATYRVAPLTAMIIRGLRLMRTPHFSMPNMLTEMPLVPELIQQDATPQALAGAVTALLDDPLRRAAISDRFAKLHAELALGADARAAEAVISLAERNDNRSGRHDDA